MPKPALTSTKESAMAKAVKKHITPRKKSQARPVRPGPFDVIADGFDLDRVDCAPSHRLGFRLHLGDGNRWSSQAGRMEMHPERAVDHALKILSVADEWGTTFTLEQRKRIAEFALGPVRSKRQGTIMDRYNARDITLAQAKNLHEEIRERYLSDVEALVDADTRHRLGELLPITCEYTGANEICVWLKTKTGDPVTLLLSSDSMMCLTNLMVAVVQNFTAQVLKDLRATAAAAA
jgi:hypothetical protein